MSRSFVVNVWLRSSIYMCLLFVDCLIYEYLRSVHLIIFGCLTVIDIFGTYYLEEIWFAGRWINAVLT